MSVEASISGERVLVTGVGGPSGICLLRGLEKRGLTLFAGDIDPYAAGLYLVEADRRVILARGDEMEFAAMLLEWCEREAVEVVVPTVDSELIPLAVAREQFEAAGVQLVLAPLQTLETCLDKWMLHAHCHEHVRTPQTLLVDDAFDPSSASLPGILKPRVGSGSRGISLVESVKQMQGLERDGSLLVQEFLPGPEYSLDVLSTQGGHVVAVVPRERLKVDSGIAVTARTRHDERLEKIGREVAELIGLNGVANVQVKEDVHGEPALLEVNPRFPGTMALTVASGPDMPWLCVAEALGQPIPDDALPFKDVAMVRFFQECFLSFDEIAALQDHTIASGSMSQ